MLSKEFEGIGLTPYDPYHNSTFVVAGKSTQKCPTFGTRQKGLQSKLRCDGDAIICFCLRLLAEKRQTELVTRPQELHWSVVNCAGPQ